MERCAVYFSNLWTAVLQEMECWKEQCALLRMNVEGLKRTVAGLRKSLMKERKEAGRFRAEVRRLRDMVDRMDTDGVDLGVHKVQDWRYEAVDWEDLLGDIRDKMVLDTNSREFWGC